MSQVPTQVSDFDSTGLEDFGVSDAVLPRIKIVHTEGMWADNLGGFKGPILRFIALGLVKQRVLFHHNVEDNDVPMCKSSDHNFGFTNPDAPRNKSFPWEASGFDPADFPPDADEQRKLPCDACKLKDWGSSPLGENPYCSEQWTLPIYYDGSGEQALGEWAPAILTLQKSSIKPIRTYFTSFAQSKQPPFLKVGTGSLRVIQRGQVTYSVPTFVKNEESPRERWPEFSEQFKEMKEFLVRPPVRESGEAAPPAQSDNSYAGPPTQAAPAPAADPQQAAPAQPVQQQPPAQSGDPWPVQGQPTQPQEPPAVPVQQTPPVQTPPPAQTAPPVQQTPPPPVQQTPPVDPPAQPPAQQEQPPAPTQPAPVTQQPPTTEGRKPLPF